MPVEPRPLRRFAIATALVTLVSIASGAIDAGLKRPASMAHFYLSLIATALLVAEGLLALAARTPGLRRPAFILFLSILEAALGSRLPVLHAVLGQILFGASVAVAVITSDRWSRIEPITDSWRPSLKSLAIAVPAVVLLQTTLGAAYRYKAIGVLWHVANAMIVMLLVLIVCVFLIRQFPTHPALKPAAKTLAIITGVQVLLGFSTLLLLILQPETSASVVHTSVLHVTNGALTFGAAVALALQIRHHVAGQGASL